MVSKLDDGHTKMQRSHCHNNTKFVPQTFQMQNFVVVVARFVVVVVVVVVALANEL